MKLFRCPIHTFQWDTTKILAFSAQRASNQSPTGSVPRVIDPTPLNATNVNTSFTSDTEKHARPRNAMESKTAE